METNLLPKQKRQLESFWELIMTSDVVVQQGLYMMLDRIYGSREESRTSSSLPLLQMQGRLKVHGDESTDRQILQEHLQEKYRV
jgi:hypothetical protein